MRHPFESHLTRGPAPLSTTVVTAVTAEPTRAESRWADDGGQTPSDGRERPGDAPDFSTERSTTLEPQPVGALTSHYPGPLDRLYTRHTLISTGRTDGDSSLLHRAIIERLAANRRIAEGEGWTSLALERVAGMGQLRLYGVPAGGEGRAVVPDWAPR